MTLRQRFINWLTTQEMRDDNDRKNSLMSYLSDEVQRAHKDVEHWKAVVKEAQDCIDLANAATDKADYRRNLAVRLELEARREATLSRASHAEQRNDFQERLGEKDAQIRLLRTENASLKLECDRMRSVLLPFASPSGAAYAQRFDTTAQKPPQVPAFAGPDDWQAELDKMYREEAHAAGERREELHEQAADDGAQPSA